MHQPDQRVWFASALLLCAIVTLHCPAADAQVALPPCNEGIQCPKATLCSANRCLTAKMLFGARIDLLGHKVAIAVVPIRATDRSPEAKAAAKALNAVFAQNFGRSYLFRRIPTIRFPYGWQQDSLHPSTTPHLPWRQQGADGVVSGWVRRVGIDRVEVSLYLLPLVVQTVTPPPEISVFVSAKTRSVRALGHLFANQVAKSYTGRAASFGTKIAFAKRTKMGVKEIFVTEYLSGVEEQVTKDGSLAILPAFSYDGLLAYTSYRRGNPDLYLDGKLFSARRKLNIGAAFGPDGRTVAISLSKDGNNELYLLSRKSGAILRRLTRRRSIDISPSWSPDGKKLAYVSDRSGSPQVWVMDLVGSERPRRISRVGPYSTSPNWSPDGTMIAFCGQVGARFQIFVHHLTSGKTKRLTRAGNNTRPAFSRDSRLIVFASKRNKVSRLFLMRADGTGIKQISTGRGDYFGPAWSR